MSRLIIVLVAVLVVIGGGMVALASKNSEKPLAHVEKDVSLANLAQ